VQTILRHKVTAMAIAPISLQRVLAALPAGVGPLPTLKMIEVAGSVMPTALLAQVRRKLCDNVVSAYGSTEVHGVAAAPFAAMGGNPQAVGYIYSDTEIQAVDENDQPLPPGTEGILRMRSDHAATEYFGDPVATAQVFRGGWFYCGDVGTVWPDGLLTISGRVGEFINSGGNKVAPHVIEDVLLSLPGVTEAAAFGVPDRNGVVQIWAAIVAPVTIDQSVLTRLCREKLAGRAPKYIIQMKGLPRNANGKILRDVLIQYGMQTQP
jgi:fatty-acyl-CoA synthase